MTHKLCNDALHYITEHFDLESLYHFMLTNKSYYNLFEKIFLPQIKKNVKFIKETFPDFIIETMNGIAIMALWPILEYKKSFESEKKGVYFNFKCMDNIKPEDMFSRIMIGKDFENRGFICFRLKYDNETRVEILYQCDKNHKIEWRWAKSFYLNPLYNTIDKYDSGFAYSCIKDKWAPKKCPPAHLSKSVFPNNYYNIGINDPYLKNNIALLHSNVGYVKRLYTWRDHVDIKLEGTLRNVELQCV